MPSLNHIAKLLSADLWGDGTLNVERLSDPTKAGPADLALAMSPQYEQSLKDNQSVKAAALWEGADPKALGLEGAVFIQRSRLALSSLTGQFKPQLAHKGIHPLAHIGETCTIGQNVTIGPFSVIEDGAVIEDDVSISSHVHISSTAVIKAKTLILKGVYIGANVTIGEANILHPNAVIGDDGFSFVTKDPSHAETGKRHIGRKPFEQMDGTWHKIQSLGGVITGANVDIGANSAVDAGTIHPTSIGDGTKIDNLVQVGHNVQLGRDCLLCSHVAVAGSTQIGDRVILAGKAGVADHVKIGSDVVAAGAAIILSDVGGGQFVSGHPAQPMTEYRATQKALRNLRTKP